MKHLIQLPLYKSRQEQRNWSYLRYKAKKYHTKRMFYMNLQQVFYEVKFKWIKITFQLNLFHLSWHLSLYLNVGTTLLFIFLVGIFHIYTMKITMFILAISIIFPLKEFKMWTKVTLFSFQFY